MMLQDYFLVVLSCVEYWHGREEVFEESSKSKVEPLMSHGLFNNVLNTFLDPERGSCCLCRVRKLSDFIKQILICGPEMNKCLMGLELNEGE